MHRFAIIIMTFAGIAVAGTAFALFQGQSLDGKIADSRVVRPVTEVTPAPAAADGKQASRKCGSSSGCGSSAGGGSCCSSGPGDASAAALRVEQIRAYLVDYYSRILGEGISVEVRDLGCHQEADILKADKVIKRLSISGGAVSEIT